MIQESRLDSLIPTVNGQVIPRAVDVIRNSFGPLGSVSIITFVTVNATNWSVSIASLNIINAQSNIIYMLFSQRIRATSILLFCDVTAMPVSSHLVHLELSFTTKSSSNEHAFHMRE